jgi:trimethylamine--corrinoid protein Co-methyltransferase
MALKGFSRNFKPLEILTEQEVEAIHRGTLEVLWKTGVRMEHERALKLLKKNGCQVDYHDMRVRFPPALVEDSLRKCPSVFGVKARDPRNDLMLGGNTTYLSPFPGMSTVDLDTWEPRTATRKEFYDGLRVEDGLETVSLIQQYTPYFAFEGVPPVMAMAECMAGKIRSSTKFTAEGYANESEIFTIQMAQAVGAEMFVPCLPASPLAYYYDAIEAALRGVEAGFPIKEATGPVLGGTAPASTAGAIISANAELIGAIVLFQLVKPGTRIIVSDLIFPQNMRTGSPAFGAIGSSMHTAGFNQMWRGYGVPTSNTATITSSKQIDFQAGYEKAISALLFTLSGASLLQFHGAIYGELSHHPVQAILDDDVAGMIGRFIQGIEVNDETLAIDLIEEVGPIPGHFLSKAHTRKWWKLEQFVPRAADRLTYPEWMKSGKKSCLDYARERMEEILATHKPTPLAPSQEEDIERILEEARKYYREKGLITEEEMATYRESMKSPDYPYG